jgi:glycine/D-amino acid oxidase-like deaminating enzyme
MRTAVVGGGIVGLFAAYHLQNEGAEVTLFEPGGLGAGSVHAAGIIEPTTASPTNTRAYARHLWRLWRRGTCTLRGADGSWIVESLRQLDRPPVDRMDETLRDLADDSVAQFTALAETANDFGYAARGLVERYDDAATFVEERHEALERRARVPVEVLPGEGDAGGLYFPNVSWVDTERFAERMGRELARTTVVHDRVDRVELDGSVVAAGSRTRFEAVVACTGVSCRRLGVPLTGVRGYGWHVRARNRTDRAVIYADRGIAIVPTGDGAKVTGGWDFDLSRRRFHADRVFEEIRRSIPVETVWDFKEGSRPCTPDGLPTVGRRDRLVVATGGFRLGWSFAPALGRRAAALALGRSTNQPFLARFCGALHGGKL